MLSEVQLRFTRKDAWLQETSERHPEISFTIVSLYEAGEDVHLSLVAAPAGSRGVAQLLGEWQADGRITSVIGPQEDPRGARFHVVYPKAYSAYPVIAKHNLFSFRFVAVTRGSQYLSVIADAPDVDRLVAALKGLGEVELLSVRKVAPDASPETPTLLTPLFRNLSPMQLRALILAHDRGYYAWPRKVSASGLAKEVGLTVPSFLHHLRLAEGALIQASVRELVRLEPVRIAEVRAEGAASWSKSRTVRRPKPTPA